MRAGEEGFLVNPRLQEWRGWLTKHSRGGFTSNWNRRFFVLNGSTLYYSRTEPSSPSMLKVFAQLADAVCVEVAASQQRERCFRIVFSPSDPSLGLSDANELLFQAPSAKERQEWIEAVQHSIGSEGAGHL